MKVDNSEEKPQTEVSVTPSVLDAFALLREDKDEAKITGAAKIISQLRGEEGDKDVQYTLKRLVRSLGANVPDVRTGYFAALVTLLNKYKDISVTQLFQLVKKELHAGSGSSKSEAGDVALGQILVCGAVFRSGLMLRSSQEEQKEVVEQLLTSSKKKSYLSTVAYLILLDFINELTPEQFSSLVWPYIKPELKKDIKEHSLDSLHFLMVASKKFPNKVKLTKLIGNPEIVCEDNITEIGDKLMGGIDFGSVSHPVYKEIGVHIANSTNLLQFWTSGIDTHLTKHNRNRELVGINILHNILENIKENYEVIPDLLSRNFFKLFMDWFKGLQTASKIRNKRDNEDDHKIMIKKQRELLNSLSKALKGDNIDSKVRVAVLKKILFSPGEMNFTEVTGTTVVKSIISDLDKQGVKDMAQLLKEVLLNTSKKIVKDGVERLWFNNERVKAAELISYLVSLDVVKDNPTFKLKYMKLLMCFGFFKIGGDENIVVSAELSGSIKACFYRCFTSNFLTVDNLVSVLSSLSHFICDILKKEEIRTKMEKQFPEENMECWNMLMEVCGTIEKVQSKSKVDNVFLILLYQLGLFLFSEPTYVKLAKDSIKELKSCYEHYRKKTKKSKKKEDSSDEPEWIEVLVEVLLSILSAESSVFRSVVQCVFRLLREYLTPSAIGQIVSVLDPESEAEPLTNESDSENEMDEDKNDSASEDSESENEENESDSDVEGESDEELKTSDELRMAVQKALGTIGNESDAESIDIDNMDEEEGKKLDEALAEAFKQFHHGKGKAKKKERKNKKALSDFRIRVLDLIDIYLEKDPSMDLCLGMIPPLTRCLEFCIADNQFSELENRVRKTIKTLAKVRKFSTTEDVTVDSLCDYLKATIDKGQRSHFMFQAQGDVITCFATFIIHCSQKVETDKKASPLVEIFKDAVNSYFQNRNCFLPIIFFHSILQSEWEGNYKLVPLLIENVFNKEVRQFRRNEGLELVAGFYRSLRRNKPTDSKHLKKLAQIEASFENSLKQVLSSEDFEAKNNFFVILKKLIKTMEQFHSNCQIPTSIDFKNLLETLSTRKGTVKIANNNKNNKNQVNGDTVPQSEKKKKKKNRKKKMNGHAEQEPPQKKSRTISNQSE